MIEHASAWPFVVLPQLPILALALWVWLNRPWVETGIITARFHGLERGDLVVFSSAAALPSGLGAGLYAIIQADDNSFQAKRQITVLEFLRRLLWWRK